MEFDGKSYHEEASGHSQLNFGAADGYTIMCRMKTATTNNVPDYTGLISKMSPPESPSTGWQLLIFNNCIAAAVWESDKSNIGPTSKKNEMVGTTPLNDGEWHHVAMTVDRLAGTAVLYVDGKAEKTVTNKILKINPDTKNPLRIGVDRELNYFSGEIQDVKIWNRFLDAEKIQNEAANIPDEKPANPPTVSSERRPSKNAPTVRTSVRSKSARRPVQTDTPEYLIPRMGKLPVSDAMHFVTAHLISGAGSAEAKVISSPLKLKPAAPAQLPATGVLLTHEQGWFARGLGLGNLLHSITLAPGEVTQVAVTEWRRQESGSAQESTQQDDSSSATDQRDRAVDEVQQSTLREVQSGSSSASSDGGQAQDGISLPFFSVSAGISSSEAYSTNYSDGTRDLSLSENQKINEATVRNAQASRSRRAAVVRETSQAESEQLTTRVLANYNHAHALTMMYFEVVEVFDLTTKVIDAERLIYLPMEVAEIDTEMLHRFGPKFAQAAKLRGETALAAEIEKWIEARRTAPAFEGERTYKRSEQCGITSGGTEFSDDLSRTASILSIAVTHSDKRIDTIQTTWLLTDGSKKTGARHGTEREGNAQVSEIKFAEDEFLVSIEGRIDMDAEFAGNKVVVSLTVNSNKRTYGPYGDLNVTRGQGFGPVFLEDALGFFGRSGYAVDAIGLLSYDDTFAIRTRLNREKLFYNQVMWVSQEPGAVIESLRDVKWPADAALALSESVDPRPVTLTGNYVGYRWHFEDNKQRKAFLKKYIDSFDAGEIDAAMSHSASVAVATGGVFGEAVLGQAVSAEKIDLSRFWKWQDSMIPILPPQINPLTAGGRARDVNTTTGQVSESAAKLDQLAALPDPAGFSAASQMMTSNIFRDMSGSGVVQALALDASKHAADGADNAAKIASDNLNKFMDLVKDLGKTALQKGMDSTTQGGMQSGPEEEIEGEPGEESASGLTGEAGEMVEEAGAVAPELAEVAAAVPFIPPV